MLGHFANSRNTQNEGSHFNRGLSRQRQGEKSRRQSSKDFHPKSPPTPNLEFLKQNRMKKQIENERNQCIRHKSPISILQQSSANDDNQQETPFKTHVCTSHPNKKAKYFLASDINVRLCTACAVNYAQVQPVLDQQRYHKLKGIQDFKSMIKMVKGFLSQRQQQTDRHFKAQDQHYQVAMRMIDQQFQSIILLVQQKHSQLVDSLTRKYKQSSQTLKNQRTTISSINNSMDKYLSDVHRNYEQIISDLSVKQFDDIMNQYKDKISDYISKIDKPFDPLPDIQHIKNQAHDISGRIKRITFDALRYSTFKPTIQRIQNHNFMNILKAKTPDRHHDRIK